MIYCKLPMDASYLIPFFHPNRSMAALVSAAHNMDTFQRDLAAIMHWFATLDSPARTTALQAMAGLASPHELAALVPVVNTSHENKTNTQYDPASTTHVRRRLPQRQASMPPPGSWPSDPKCLYAWLRMLRLHKYTSHLAGLEPSELRAVDYDALIRLGIDTHGARTKLLKVGL